MKSLIIFSLTLANLIHAAPLAAPLPNPNAAVPNWNYYAKPPTQKRDALQGVADWNYYPGTKADKRDALQGVADWNYYPGTKSDKRDALPALIEALP